MADYILGENQLKLVVELLKEQDVSEKIDYCKDTFGTRTPEYRFCTKAAAYLKSQKSYQSDFREYLEYYVDSVVVDTISIERLSKDHPILSDGIKEIEEFKSLMGSFCNNLNTDEMIKKLIDDDHVYYKTPDGKYSVFNRLDTNYSALAVSITYYYKSKEAFDLLMQDMGQKLSKIDWISRMFDPKNIKFDSKKIFNSILKVLKNVRERGFATEDLFQEKLDEYNIPYKRYARDYGFVDRFLGVDFAVQKGNEWLPVQVKTSKIEPQYKIEELDCDEPIIAIRDGDDFRLNNSRGFERYFCDFLKVCRKNS